MKSFTTSIIVGISVICFCLIPAAYAEKVRIITTEEPPTNYTRAGEFSGTTTDIVNEIKKRIGEDAPIEVMPWARAYNAIALKTPNVVIFTGGKTKERVDLGFNFIGPVITRNHTLYKRSDDGRTIINSLDDIKNGKLKVGVMRGDWRAGFFKDNGIEIDEGNSHVMNINKLLGKRFDLMALSDLEISAVMNEAAQPIDMVKPAFVFKEGASYILISKDSDKEIVKKWDNAFKEIQKTDFFEKAAKKWSDILMMDMGYQPDKGFYIK
ncbi:MAG: transporter substrate-binding domain-containing protein [Desulfamplus sp.]|nr:transporter substrate-binding domain-containing protein [Desulfamplus sp.]